MYQVFNTLKMMSLMLNVVSLSVVYQVEVKVMVVVAIGHAVVVVVTPLFQSVHPKVIKLSLLLQVVGAADLLMASLVVIWTASL